jgi:hypothetical protein
VPTKGTKSALQNNGNNYTDKDAVVKGSNNMINPGTKKVMIQGDYNMVESYTENINIQGDSNIIKSGVKNVTLINTSGVTVDESDVTYINGVIVGRVPYDVVTITTNTNASTEVKTYLIDASGASVDLTFNIPVTNFYEGQTWFVKAIDVTNTVRIVVTGGLIDGAANYTISTVDDGVEVQYYDGDFYIVSNKNTGGGGGSGLTQEEVEGLI